MLPGLNVRCIYIILITYLKLIRHFLQEIALYFLNPPNSHWCHSNVCLFGIFPQFQYALLIFLQFTIYNRCTLFTEFRRSLGDGLGDYHSTFFLQNSQPICLRFHSYQASTLTKIALKHCMVQEWVQNSLHQHYCLRRHLVRIIP